MSAPLLGVAGPWGEAEIELAGRFDDLHQLLYRRGGLRPSNAVVEEIAKLVLIRLHAPSIFDTPSVDGFRAAFAAARHDPSLTARDPSGLDHPLWPVDEPFRITDHTILAAAAALVADLVPSHRPRVADPLGTAFDALLAGRYDHAGGLGTYLTPSSVARMMAEVAVPLVQVSTVEGPFGDPYCGTGRFLVALLEVLRASDDRLLAAGPFGADVSSSAVAKARINMLLYGVPRPLVWTVRDSVTDPGLDPLRERVPLILTNPPFGEGKYDDPMGLAATAKDLPGLDSRSRIDPSLACLVRSLRLLAPGGVLGIVLPDGIITGRPFEELVLGRRGPLAGEVHLAAAVSLPTATFSLSGTVARTSAVFLRRGVPSRQVALARVAHVGYLRQAGKAAPDPMGDQLPEVAGALSGSGPPSPLVAVVEADAVRTLDPSRLDPDALAARQSLVDSGGVELREYLDPVPARRARQITAPFVSVLHVDDLGCVDWPAAAGNVPTTPGLLVEAGQLIVSLLNPARLRAAVLPQPAQVSAEFGVFATAGDPYAILGLLYTPAVRAQLRPLGTGTSSSRRRIDAEDVLSLIVPKLDPAALDALARAVREAQQQIGTARAALHTLYGG
jgi:N-6 DNA methylase